MRLALVTIAVVLIAGVTAFHLARSGTRIVSRPQVATTSADNPPKRPDFDSEIKPILQARCQPCHFQGGKVYDKLPFDKPETITKLGTKLFTRIKDEKEQKLIRAFLEQQ